MTARDLNAAGAAAQRALTKLERAFGPAYKLTLLARNVDDSDAHVVVSKDDTDAAVEALEQLAREEGIANFLARCAKDCKCCARCYERPCGGCCAGGVCDAMRCTCDDEDERERDDNDE
jgi:hypothetical protein